MAESTGLRVDESVGQQMAESAGRRAAEKYLLAQAGADGLLDMENVVESAVKVFDTHGVEILKNAGKRDIIVMDELGTMESGAHVFQGEVFRRLERGKPVLGVLKAASTPFLDAIRLRGDVRVIEVTRENRERVVDELCGCFEQMIGQIMDCGNIINRR